MKRIISLLLVILMCITLVACGNNKDHIGEAKTPSGSSAMKGRDYERVVQNFQEKGFTNIRLEKIEDLITGWLTKDGEVEKVTVGGNKDYSPDKWLPADTEVIIYYHTFADGKVPESENLEIETTSESVIPETETVLESITLEVEEQSAANEIEPPTTYAPSDGSGFSKPVYEDYTADGFSQIDIAVEGTIIDSWRFGIIVCDEDNNMWEVAALFPTYDFSEYIGTTCDVYGRVEYLAPSASPIPNIPSISLFSKESYCIIFCDGKVFTDYLGAPCDEFPLLADEPQQSDNNVSEQNDYTTQRGDGSDDTSIVNVPDEEESGENLVWVPTNGGTKYHSRSGCSNMKAPRQVTEETAVANGYTPCKRCH